MEGCPPSHLPPADPRPRDLPTAPLGVLRSSKLDGGCSSASCASLPGRRAGGSPPSALRSTAPQLLLLEPHLYKDFFYVELRFSFCNLPKISSMVCPVASSKTTPCSSCSYCEKILKRWKEVDGNLKQREVRERVGGDVWLAPPPRGVNVFLELHPPFFLRTD